MKVVLYYAMFAAGICLMSAAIWLAFYPRFPDRMNYWLVAFIGFVGIGVCRFARQHRGGKY